MKKALLLLSAIGILATVSISYGAFIITAGNNVPPLSAQPQEVAIQTKTLAKTLIGSTAKATGFRYHGDTLLTKANSVNGDGQGDTTNDNVQIDFQVTRANLGAVLAELNNNVTGTATLNFSLCFSSTSNVPSHFASMIENGDFYLSYLTLSSGEQAIVPMQPWHIDDNATVSQNGTLQEPVKSDTSKRKLTVSYLLCDWVNNMSVDVDWMYQSLYDLYVPEVLSRQNQLSFVFDFDLSVESGLTPSDFGNLSIEIEVLP